MLYISGILIGKSKTVQILEIGLKLQDVLFLMLIEWVSGHKTNTVVI